MPDFVTCGEQGAEKNNVPKLRNIRFGEIGYYVTIGI